MRDKNCEGKSCRKRQVITYFRPRPFPQWILRYIDHPLAQMSRFWIGCPKEFVVDIGFFLSCQHGISLHPLNRGLGTYLDLRTYSKFRLIPSDSIMDSNQKYGKFCWLFPFRLDRGPSEQGFRVASKKVVFNYRNAMSFSRKTFSHIILFKQILIN